MKIATPYLLFPFVTSCQNCLVLTIYFKDDGSFKYMKIL